MFFDPKTTKSTIFRFYNISPEFSNFALKTYQDEHQHQNTKDIKK